jgi:PAS domain S-box-containing protein
MQVVGRPAAWLPLTEAGRPRYDALGRVGTRSVSGQQPATGRYEMIATIRLSPVASLLTDPAQADNPIIAVNTAFEDLTGYAADELVGRNCRLLAGPETSHDSSMILANAVRHARPAFSELINYRKSGAGFLNAVMIAPILGDEGQPLYFLGSQMDIGVHGGARRREACNRLARLSARQREVLKRITLGMRNKQIALDLAINEETVKMHRAAAIERLGVATSADAIRMALEGGL